MQIDVNHLRGDRSPAARPWSDLAEFLDDIRSPRRSDIEEAIRAASGDDMDAAMVARIADAVTSLYRRRPAAD